MKHLRISVLFLVLFLSAASGSARQPAIDSISSELGRHTLQDRERVDLLHALAVQYQQINADSTRQIATRALGLADRISYATGKANAMVLLAIAADISGDYREGLDHAAAAYNILIREKDKPGQARALNAYAGLLYHQSRFAEALEYYNKSLKVWEQTGNRKGKGSAYVNIASIYAELGNYTQAIRFYLQGLNEFKSINDRANLSATLSNIAATYTDLGQYKEAAYYNDQGMALNMEDGNDRGLMQNLVTKGVVQSAGGAIREALENFEKAAAIARKSGDHYWLYLAMENMASAHNKLGNPDRALEYYQECLKAAASSEDVSGMISARTGIGHILVGQQKPAAAIAVLTDAYNIAVEHDYLLGIQDASGQLSLAYEQLGNAGKALHFYKIHNRYQDSLSSDSVRQQVQRLQFGYQIQQKEQEISHLQAKQQMTHSNLRQQQTIAGILAGGFILVLLLSAGLFYNRKKLKQNHDLVLEKNREIRQQQDKLEEMNRFKDRVISILSHDVRSPLNALEGTLPLLESGIISGEEFSDIRLQMENQLRSIHTLIDNLVLWSKGNIGKQGLLHEKIEIGPLIEDNFRLLGPSAAGKQISLTADIPPGACIRGNSQELDAIFRNLIANAIKFTPKGGQIALAAACRDNKWEIAVKDNGLGMTAAQIEQVRQGRLHQGNYGTCGEKGSGLGLALTLDFLAKHGGSLDIFSLPGQGSVFTVILPAAATRAATKV